MSDNDDFQPDIKSKKRKRSDSKPKATQAGSITAFFNSTKTEKPVINLTEEKENANNSENNSEGEVRRSPRKRRRVEPSSNNDSNGHPSSSPVPAQEVIFIADSQSQPQPKNAVQKTATPTKPKRGKSKQKEVIDESSNKENSAAPVNVEPTKVENTPESVATSTEGDTIGRRLRPRSPVKTADGQASSSTSPSKTQNVAAQIEVDSSDPPSTSASEDNFFTRMAKRTPTKSKKKEEVIPAAPKVDEVFAVKPGEKVHDFFLAASKKKEMKLQRELQKLDEEVAESRSLAQQITGDKKPHPFLLKNPAFKMTVVKEKQAGEVTEQVPFEGPTLRLIEFPFVSHVGIVTRDDRDKMEDLIESSNSGNSADLFSSNESQSELAPNSPSADPALFRDVLDSCVKVRLSDIVVNPIKKAATVEIKEDTPITAADLEQFEKTSAFEAIVGLIDQQQLAFNSPELTISQALNAANDTASGDEDSDSSQSTSSKKKEKIENFNPKSHFVDPATLDQDQIRSHLRTTMAKTIKQSNDSQVKANQLWTDKYAPTAVNEVSGNIIAVKFLSAWMSKWKTQKTKERKRKNKKDDDDEYMVEQLPNTVLLHGASGVGKTAAVYACAKQIGLSVLELNPSSQRSAKEVAKYGEITQSQAIRGQSKDTSDAPKENNQTLNNFFKVQSKQPAKDKPAASEAQFDNTILLFDEVDIIDEEKDRGFYSALVDLVKSTKRPIIVTCNTIPEELSALLNLPILQLKLRPMPKAHFLSYLKLVALCEGTNFTIQPAAHALEKFATFMKWDLRKSLLNLQFWLQQHDNDGMNSLVMKNDMDTPKDNRLRLYRNNLLESCFGYAHLASKYSNLFWTFLLGQEIPQNGPNDSNNSSDSQQQSFFSFYYNKQRQKLMQSNNEDSPLFFSATIPKSEVQWKMEKEDTFFIAETAHLLRLDIIFNNYLQLFIEPVLPYQQALFNMKKTYEQIEVEEKVPILVLQDTPEEKPTIEITESKPSDETSEKQPEKKSPINSPKKTTTLLNFFTKATPTSPSKEPKVATGQTVTADPTNVTAPEVEEKKEIDVCPQQLPKIIVPAKPKVSPYKEDFVIEKRLEDKLVKAEVTQANRLGELIFNDIVQLSEDISAADEMDTIQCPSFMSDKWPYDFKPRIYQSEMSSAYEILSLRTCVANTCNQDWSIMLADRSTPSSGTRAEPLESFFDNHSVNLSTDDTTAEQIHFQKKIETVVGPLMDSLVFRLSKTTCLEYTWFYQQLCFFDEDREKTNTKRRFTSILPKFRVYANECKMLKEMCLVKY